MTAQVFCHRVDDNICTQLKRSLEIWRRKRIVHHKQWVVGMGMDNFRNGAYVCDTQVGIGRRLQPDQPRGGGQRVCYGLWIGGVGKGKVQVEAAQNLVEQTE